MSKGRRLLSRSVVQFVTRRLHGESTNNRGSAHPAREARGAFESDMTCPVTRARLDRSKFAAEGESAPPKYTMGVPQMTKLKEVPSQSPIRILLVDDHPACLATLRSVLTCNSYIVETVLMVLMRR
jgi:hypothetical protein